MAKVLKTTFQLRRGYEAAWEKNNPVLAQGEPGFVIDKNAFKIGDGVTAWNDLDFIAEKIYRQSEAPIDAEEGSLWLDLDEEAAVSGGGAAGNEVFIGTEPPTDANASLWIDTDEEGSGGSGIDVTASVGQTIVVEEVDENGKPTKWKAMDFPEAEQADWNASEGEPGHVLNRPFYSEVVSTVLIDNQTYPVDQELYHDFPLIVGQSYHVVFDGVEYDETAKTIDAGGMTIVYLGNVGMFDVDQDNGMPYTIMYLDGTGTGIMPMGDTVEQFTVSISTISEVVQKLPEKFLPEGIGYKGKGEIANGSTELFDGELFFASETPLVVGKTYEVTYNGTDYSCTAFELDVLGDGSTMVTAIGNHNGLDYDGTGEPFVFIDCIALGAGGYQVIDFTGATEVTIRIVGEMVVPIPAEYMINAFPYYVTVYFTKDSLGNVDSLTCTDTVANVEAALKSGRQIAVKYTVQGGENIMFQILQLVLVYPTDPNYGSQLSFMCKGDILGMKSSENWVILKPQEDGTYLVDTTAFND